MKKTFRLKMTSIIIAVLLLLSVFPVSALDKSEAQSAVVDSSKEYELKNENSLLLTEENVDSKYENYTLDNMPEKLKNRVDLSEAECLDVTDASDPNSVTVVNKDGTRLLTIFNEPVKYVDEETEKVEFIDNSLVVSKNGSNAFESVKNNKKSYFPKDIGKGVYLTYNNRSVTITPVRTDQKKNGKIKYSKVKIKRKDYAQYDGVFGEKTFLQYTPTNNGIKENIILEEYTGTNEFSYIIDAKNLIPNSLKGSSITFVDPKTDEPVFKIEETFIYDSRYNSAQQTSDCVSYDNYYTIEKQKNGKYLLTSIIDNEFLQSKDTVYPVTVDPYTTWLDSTSDVMEYNRVPLSEDHTDTYGYLYLGRCYTTVWRIWVQYRRMKQLRIINPDLVISAKVLVDVDETPSSSVPICLGTTTDYKSVSDSPDAEECFYPYLEIIGRGQITKKNDNEIDITNTFLKWLEFDSQDQTYFWPGFVMYLEDDIEFEKDTFFIVPADALPVLSIYYISDQTLKDDIYYIKNINNYMCVGENDEIYFTKSKDIAIREGLWQAEVDETLGFYTITNLTEGLRLHQSSDDVISAEIENLVPNQDWRVVGNPDGTRRLICRYPYNEISIKALTVNESYDSCTATEYEYNEYQNWTFEPFRLFEPEVNVVEKTKSQWPTAKAKDSSKNLLKGRKPIYMEYKTDCTFASSGIGVPYTYVGSQITDGKELTDGSIDNYNIDLRGYTLKHYYESDYIRFVSRQTNEYRSKGELYLDMVFDLGSEKSFNSIWFATNTENNNYTIGAFEVYASNNLDDLYYTRNKIAEFDHCESTWSGVLNINYLANQQRRYFGLRVTQGVLNGTWTSAAINHAYARIRDIALFDSSAVTALELEKYSKTMQLGTSASAGAIIFPSKATNKSIVVTSSNPTVASVDSSTNQITANSVGDAVITVTTVDGGFVRTCDLTVANYCGGNNYKDVTEHSLELEDDGYYVCSRCNYRIQSPELQDQSILSNYDYNRVISLMFLSTQLEAYERYCGSASRGMFLPEMKSLSNEIGRIRSQQIYRDKYEYIDSDGNCYFVEETSDVELDVNIEEITSSNIGDYNGVYKAFSIWVSAFSNDELSAIDEVQDLVEGKMNVFELGAIIARVAERKDWEIGLTVAAGVYEIIENYDVHIGDTAFTITVGDSKAEIFMDSNDRIRNVRIDY